MLQNYTILRAAAEHRSALVSMLSELNSTAESQCLHCDTEHSGIAVEIDNLLAHNSIPLIVALDNRGIAAVLGCELNTAGTHCWLRGPFLRSSADIAVLAAVYEQLASSLPSTLTDMMAFPNVENTTARAFYTQREFSDTHTIHIYTAPRPAILPPAVHGIHEYSSDLFEQLQTLHDLAFTTAVERATDIAAALDEDHRVFVYTEQGVLAGYIHVSISNTPAEGFVEFLAVHPDYRGRGIGEQLLQHAMHWFFAERAMPQAGLCVRDTVANARRLYERAGFSLFASGIGMRRTLQASNQAQV